MLQMFLVYHDCFLKKKNSSENLKKVKTFFTNLLMCHNHRHEQHCKQNNYVAITTTLVTTSLRHVTRNMIISSKTISFPDFNAVHDVASFQTLPQVPTTNLDESLDQRGVCFDSFRVAREYFLRDDAIA